MMETMGKRWKRWGKWWGNDGNNGGNDGNDGGNHLKMTNLWMPVTSLIMVRFSIRKKVLESSWSALQNDSRNDRETMQTTGGNDGNDGRNDGNNRGNHLKMTNLWMPVTSLIMVRFSICKKFWKALGLLYQMTVEMTGKRRQWQGETMEMMGEMTGKPWTGFLLNIRLGMLPTVVSTWYPVVSPCVLPGLWFKIRLEMLSSVVSWFPFPWCRGVLPGFGLKIRLEMLSSVVSWFPPLWCRGVLPGSWLEIRLEICLHGFP